MSKQGRVLWYAIQGENPRPFLCVHETVKNMITCYDFLDVEFGDVIVLLDIDVERFVGEGQVFWDEP